MTTAAELLKKARKNANFTQQGLAVAAGVADSTVSRIERGEQLNPELETLKAFAKAMGIDVRELIPSATPPPVDYQALGTTVSAGIVRESVFRKDHVPKAYFDFSRTPRGRKATQAQLDAVLARVESLDNSRGQSLEDFEKAWRDLFEIREDKRSKNRAQATDVDPKKLENLASIRERKA